MRTARRFLSPGGTLILLEGTAPERWIDITFGLTDGWWAFEDTELRPSYPLLSRRQWIEILGAAGFEDPIAIPESFDLSRSGRYHGIKSAYGSETGLENSSGVECNWIVFAERDGIGTGLAGRIAGPGHACVTVSTGRAYERRSKWEWSIQADRPEDYHRLFDELRRENLTNLKGVVHLWSLEAGPPSAETTLSLDSVQLLGSGSLLYLLQAMSVRPAGHPLPNFP